MRRASRRLHQLGQRVLNVPQRALGLADIDGADLVEVKAELAIIGRNDQQIEAAAGRLGLEPTVSAVCRNVIHRSRRGHQPLVEPVDPRGS